MYDGALDTITRLTGGPLQSIRNLTRSVSLAALASIWSVAASAASPSPKPAPTPDSKVRQLSLESKPWKGDFDGMEERRMIRFLVPYSRTLYFNDKGRERGITAELVREFERWINKKLAATLGKRPITVYIIPTTRDKMIPEIVSGAGDIAAGNLTATDERLALVDFIAPKDRKSVAELVVTTSAVPAMSSASELSGKTVHVRNSSSYYESLEALNAALENEGKAPVRLALVPDALEDEDMLEMVNAGLLQYLVVDDWKANAWAAVLPKIRVQTEAKLRTGGYVGWAYRKDSPELKRVLDEFYLDYVKRQGVAAVLTARYTKRIKQISNNAGEAERARFRSTLALFRKYGEKYGFDPIMLAAQGYQESQLNQNAKSAVGAIGVMQIMPATGQELGVGDIHDIENNIHGGAKYMDKLMTRYFPDAQFSPNDRPLFAFASYNAGPGNISKMRKEAAKRGLDPDKWFNNVEIVVAQKIGIETTTYVRNIYKYYVAYTLQLAAIEAQEKAREQVAPGKP